MKRAVFLCERNVSSGVGEGAASAACRCTVPAAGVGVGDGEAQVPSEPEVPFGRLHALTGVLVSLTSKNVLIPGQWLMRVVLWAFFTWW